MKLPRAKETVEILQEEVFPGNVVIDRGHQFTWHFGSSDPVGYHPQCQQILRSLGVEEEINSGGSCSQLSPAPLQVSPISF